MIKKYTFFKFNSYPAVQLNLSLRLKVSKADLGLGKRTCFSCVRFVSFKFSIIIFFTYFVRIQLILLAAKMLSSTRTFSHNDVRSKLAISPVTFHSTLYPKFHGSVSFHNLLMESTNISKRSMNLKLVTKNTSKQNMPCCSMSSSSQ